MEKFDSEEKEQYLSALPFLPPLNDKTLNTYYTFYGAFVLAVITFGALLAPLLEVRMGIGGECRRRAGCWRSLAGRLQRAALPEQPQPNASRAAASSWVLALGSWLSISPSCLGWWSRLHSPLQSGRPPRPRLGSIAPPGQTRAVKHAAAAARRHHLPGVCAVPAPACAAGRGGPHRGILLRWVAGPWASLWTVALG